MLRKKIMAGVMSATMVATLAPTVGFASETETPVDGQNTTVVESLETPGEAGSNAGEKEGTGEEAGAGEEAGPGEEAGAGEEGSGSIGEGEDVELPPVVIGDTAYETFEAAMADAAKASDQVTVKLNQDMTSNGVSVPSGSNIVIDLNGCTLTFDGKGAGSTGTETQCFQLLKDSNIVIRDGSISIAESNKKGGNFKMIIQNYANLQLSGVFIDGSNINTEGGLRYMVSNNCGEVSIDNTSICAPDGHFALDSCKFRSYSAPTVTLAGENYFTGNIELTGGKLNIESGTYEGKILRESGYTKGDVSITGGTFSDAPAAEFIPEGYNAWADGNGYYYVVEDSESDIVKVSAPTLKETSFVYTGEEQVIIPEADGYTVENGSATEIGEYTATLKLKEGYQWSDLTLEDKEIKYSIVNAKIDVPEAAEDLVYNGEEQVGVAEGDGYTVENGKATNAGEYEATLKLNKGCEWADGTTEDKTIKYVIAAAKIDVPVAVDDLVYNGKDQVAVKDGEGYAVENGFGKNAGSYTATVKLAQNYAWADGTTEDKTIDFVIAKAKIDIPEPVEGLVYNGEEQVGVKDGEGYIVEDGSDVSAKKHVAVVVPDKNHTWLDGSTDEINVIYTIAKAKVEIPTAAELKYNGKEQVGVKDGTGYTVENGSATKPGTYTAVAKVGSNYRWADGTRTAKEIEYTIKADPVKVPAAATKLVYNGKSQTAVKADLGYTVENGAATNAGTYKATLKLDEGLAWEDGSTEAKTVSYTIAKAAPTLKVSTLSAKKSKVKKKSYTISTVAAKANSTSKVTFAKSSGSKYLSISKSGKVTVKKHKFAKKTKSVSMKVKVTIPSTSNYNGATKYITVKVNLK